MEGDPWPVPVSYLTRVRALAADIEPDDAALADWCRAYTRTHARRLAADLRLVERFVRPGAQVLEVGAVPPVLTAALAALRYRVQAVDLAPERFETAIARFGLDVHACDIEREPLPFPARAFDAVLCNEVFEHLRIDPIYTMQQMARVLRPGGRLLLSTPNLRSLRGLRQLLVHHRGQTASGDLYAQYAKLGTLGHMGHVREYTAREVAGFLVRVGFRVERVIFRGGHGRGVVGLVERIAPGFRPFFTVVAAGGTR